MNDSTSGFKIVKEKRGDTEVVSLIREDGAKNESKTGDNGTKVSKKTLVKKVKKPNLTSQDVN